ncbi:co-chaperone GrpE [Pilobolus umbonatus]|nr:co-chaperone GrpE [Pilobolus umbonatus]
MFSPSVIRNVASLSVRRTVASRLTPSATMGFSRFYTTENTNGSQETPKEEAKAEETELADEAKKIIAEKDKKIAELQDAYVRCLADQENLRERTRRDIESTKEFAIQKFAKDLLDTVDILNMALKAVPAELREKGEQIESELVKDAAKVLEQLSSLYTGVSMTEVELVKTLKRHGVERHNPEGEPFDPNLHQALYQAPIPGKEAGTIFDVQKLGYTLKGRVLRPAQVGVVSDSH